MIRNYITVAIRNLLRDKLTTAINVLGLSVAVATTILLGIGVQALLTGDGEFPGSDRLFRIITREVHGKGGVSHRAWQRPDLAEALAGTFPEIESTTRVVRTDILMAVGEQHGFQETIEVDEPFLRMFDLSVIAGHDATALSRVDQVVLTRWLADRLFGGTFSDYSELIGRTITFFGNQAQDDYTVSGILEGLPIGRSLQYNAIIRYENRKKYGASGSWDASVSTYVTLKHEESRASLEQKLPEFSREFVEPVWDKYKGNRWIDDPDAFLIQLQPLEEIRFANHVVNTYEGSVSTDVIWIEIGMMLIILSIACINFTTLSIARSTGRSLEVGIRKVLGARRVNVVCQFWGESLGTALLSLLGGLVLAELALPPFNALLGIDALGYGLQLSDLEMATIVFGSLGVVALIGVVAGTYPAVVASRFQPTETIGRRNSPSVKRRVTTFLLVGQYAMAIFLLVCTGVMTYQLDFVQSQDLGYDGDQVVVVQLRGPNRIRLGTRYKRAVKELPGVVNAALSDREFTQSTSHTSVRTPDGERLSVYQFTVDPDFFETLGIPLLAGRAFDPEKPSDRREAVVVNERLAELHGWGSDPGSVSGAGPIGQLLDGSGNYGVSKTPTVIGLVPDFHYRSFHESIAPALFHYGIRGQFNRVLVRVAPDRMAETLKALRLTWSSVAGDLPFEMEFFDEAFARQYREDHLFGRVVLMAAAIAILIACMGLFGQAAITVRQRTKEIGVRKVLGASVAQIGTLLSKDLIKLVLMANVVAWPLAYSTMSEWLSNFHYRIAIGPEIFVLCGLVALVIALATVGWLGIRAARGNPVEALRYE